MLNSLTHDFSGVVRVDHGGTMLAEAYGLAHRGHNVPNTVDTRFALASGGKSFTALAVVSLIESGTLSLDTPARDVLGSDLPLIDPAVTVEHLLAHRSGIGDYLEETEEFDVTAYQLTVPAHELTDVEHYLPMLDGYPQKFPPGTDFAYNNGGYCVLALIAQRASGMPYHQLVRSRVCSPAGLTDTDFLRSDSVSPRVATGYVPVDGEWRSNVFHLPVVGGGDGGIYSTAADLNTFWQSLYAGKIVSLDWVAEMTRPRSAEYGLGFWLPEGAVGLEGWDAGVSFRSVHRPDLTYTVLSNTSDGAWPIARFLAEHYR